METPFSSPRETDTINSLRIRVHELTMANKGIRKTKKTYAHNISVPPLSLPPPASMLVTNTRQLDAQKLNTMLGEKIDECTALKKDVQRLNAKIFLLEQEMPADDAQQLIKTQHEMLHKQQAIIDKQHNTLQSSMTLLRKMDKHADTHKKEMTAKDAEVERMRATVRKVHANLIAGKLPLEGF